MTTRELAAALLALDALPPAARDAEAKRLRGEFQGALASARAGAAREALAAGETQAAYAHRIGVSAAVLSRLLADFPAPA